jgi:hypothetical protein
MSISEASVYFGPHLAIPMSKFRNDRPPRPPKDDLRTKALMRHIQKYIGKEDEEGDYSSSDATISIKSTPRS